MIMRKKGLGKTELPVEEVIQFAAEDASPLASGVTYSSRFTPPEAVEPEIAAVSVETIERDESPAFRLLSEPTLPPLERENRARLQMQTPNRLYFYWSLKENPYKNLNRILGAQASNYTLVLKLVDLGSERETVRPIDPDGSWWFDVEDDRSYRAEVGLYAVNRPYVRVLFSNTVATPRRGPSPRPAEAAEWKVSAAKFSRVLEVAGYSRDAFDVALAGDEPAVSDLAARTAFEDYFGSGSKLNGYAAADLRLVLLTIAAGGSMASLRGRIGPTLFAFLEKSSVGTDAARAASILSRRYDIEADEFDDEAEAESAVFGASMVNFPRRVRAKRRVNEFSPISSFSVAAR